MVVTTTTMMTTVVEVWVEVALGTVQRWKRSEPGRRARDVLEARCKSQ